MSATPEIIRAKSHLERVVSDPRIKGMLGEVELCMIWEKVHSQGGDSSKTMEDELRSWTDKWDHHLCQGKLLCIRRYCQHF